MGIVSEVAQTVSALVKKYIYPTDRGHTGISSFLYLYRKQDIYESNSYSFESYTLSGQPVFQ